MGLKPVLMRNSAVEEIEMLFKKLTTKKEDTTTEDETDSGLIERVFSRNARGTIHAVKYLLDDQTTIYEK